MSNSNFKANVDKFILDTEDRIMAVVKKSIDDLVKDASKPVKDGGRMPVDTGFLRLSGTGAINQLPEGEGKGRERQPGETGVIYKSDPSGSILPLLQKLKWGDTFYYGWTAVYANVQNVRYAFLDSPAQNWYYYIKKNTQQFINSKSGFKNWSQSVGD